MISSIPKSFIDHLLTQCDIVELINYFLPLKKKGKNYVACCPFHEEKSASFTVNSEKQFFYCFGCGSGGNAITFVIKYQNIDFVKSVEWIADHLNLEIPKNNRHGTGFRSTREKLLEIMQTALHAYQTELSQSNEALEYLKKRGISKDTSQKFQLGYAPNSWNFLVKNFFTQKKYLPSELESAGLIVKKNQSHYYDRFRNRIIFPIHDTKGRCIAFGGRAMTEDQLPKYLNSPETPIFSKHQTLYGLYQATLDNASFDRIWVVEGYIDVLSLYEKGLSQVVATLGTSIHRAHLQQLSKCTEEIVFCFDGDLAGQKAAYRALTLSLHHLEDKLFIRFLILPTDEDPDSWIQKNSNVETLLLKTVSLGDFLLSYLKKGIDLSTAEGKAKLIRKVLPYLKKMPMSITREQLLTQFANVADTTLDSLENLLQEKDAAPVNSRVIHTPLKNYSVEERALGLLLQNPNLLQSVVDKATLEYLKHEYLLLTKIMSFILNNPILNTGILLEEFKSPTDQFNYLLALVHHDWMIPQNGILNEFKDILLYLERSIQEKKIKDLLYKAKNQGLSSEEKNTLYSLLSKTDTVNK